MATKQKQKEEVTVVARLRVTWTDPIAGQLEKTVKSFERAWTTAKVCAEDGYMPVHIEFLGFVRKD